MKGKYTRRCIREFLPGSGPYYFWGIVCLVITVVATTTIPLLIREAVSTLNTASDGGQLTTNARHELIVAAVVVVTLGLGLAVFRTLSRILIFIPGRRTEEKVRQRCYEAIATAPPGKLNEFQAGDLISRGTSDTTSTRVLLSMGVLHSANTVLLLGLSIYHMMSINWKLTLVCFLPAPLLQFVVRRVSRKMMLLNRKVASLLGQLSESARETIGAHTLISIYPVFEQMMRRFMKTNDTFLDSSEKLVRVRVSMSAVVQCLSGIAQVLLLWVGGRLVLAPEGGLRIEDFVAMGMYLTLLQEPLTAAGFLVTLFQRGEASLERLYAIIDIADESRREQAKKPFQDEGSLQIAADGGDVLISIKNLVYQHAEPSTQNGNGTPFSLTIPSLELRRGKYYGVFGQVGSGKTTLVSLLTGNIPVPCRKCFYRGIDYCDIPTDLLLGRFSITPQESRHFAKTIRHNIEQVLFNEAHPLIVDSAVGGTSLETALRVSQMEADIGLFPNGWESLLGEHGINLSGGQKQRLAIMRALVKPHEILVLDDVISSVDHDTETRILHHLHDNRDPDDCVIFISHRISALMPCDEILILENGTIAARGTHAELLESHHGYRKTHQHQVLEQQLAETDHGQ